MYHFRTRTQKIVQAAVKNDDELPDDRDGSKDDLTSDSDFISPSVSDESSIDISHLNGCLDDLVFEDLKPVPLPRTPNINLQEFCKTTETRYSTEVNLHLEGSLDAAINPAEDIFEEFSSINNNLSKNDNEDVENPEQCNIVPRVKKRKHNCIYCDVAIYNFARHLERQHADEIEVQKILLMEKGSLNRKQAIDKIRKEGDFCSGEHVPVQHKKLKYNEESDEDKNTITLLPCTHCWGYYSKKTLRRHVKRCQFNKDAGSSKRKRPQAEGHTLMSHNFGPNDPLRTSGVLNSLKADEVSLVAKRDKIICEVARKYIRSHKDKHLILVARRNMRRLARLLIEVRNIKNDKTLSLLSILHPREFKSIIAATRTIASYSADNKTFKSPSLALQMGTLLKKAIGAAYYLEIQKNFQSPILSVLNSIKKLIEEEWGTEVSSEAGQNLNLNRFNKPTNLPKAEDIFKMKQYLDGLIAKAKTELNSNSKNEKAYKQLIEGTYCSLLLFNKRRVGELQRILLDTYLKAEDNKPTGEFEKLLSPTEKILIQKLKRIVIKGKRGRGVPVLFDEITKDGINLAIKHRHNFFEVFNPYLFGVCHTESCISGYHIFRKHVTSALDDPNKTSTLTSTKLRKHLATIAQILNMGNEDLEQLATFMGHTSKTHNEWYRLPSDVYQTAKVSKILLLSQNNSIDQYKGRSLNEIEVGTEIIELENNSDSDEGEEEEAEAEKELLVEKSSPVQESNVNVSLNVRKIKKTVVPRKKWSVEEKKLTDKFFQKHIQKKIPPKKHEVLKLQELHPTVLKDRKWDTIKVYVCNQYTKNQK